MPRKAPSRKRKGDNVKSKQQKNKAIYVQLSPEDHQDFVDFARSQPYRTISDVVRDLIMPTVKEWRKRRTTTVASA